MAAWIDTRWFWTLLILTLCGEFLLPCLLAPRDPAYQPGTMAVSVLGRRGGPVARVYRLWLAWLGIWLLATAAVYAAGAAPVSRWLAAGSAVSLGGFALGAGILAALFPTGLTKDLSDRSALIHGVASALGFFALLFLPLWRAMLALETDSPVMAGACFAALGLALVFFTLFVLSDKDRFQGTAVAREGLWEQLCLAAMYVPLLLDAIVHLVSAPCAAQSSARSRRQQQKEMEVQMAAVPMGAVSRRGAAAGEFQREPGVPESRAKSAQAPLRRPLCGNFARTCIVAAKRVSLWTVHGPFRSGKGQ